MAQLQQIFPMAAGAAAGAVSSTPNLAYVVDIVRRSGETLSVDDLEQIYADEGWKTDRSFTWLELQALQHITQAAGSAASLEATADYTPGDCADDIAAPAMPDYLPAGKKQGPQ